MRSLLQPSKPGFTLIELMIVVAIMGIVAALAVTRVHTNPVQGATNQVQSLLYEARREAFALGPVPTGVTDPSNNPPDTMVQVVFQQFQVTGQFFNVPAGTSKGTWTPFRTVYLRSTTATAELTPQVFNVLNSPSYSAAGASGNMTTAAAPTSLNTAGTGVTLELRSDGECTIGAFSGAGAPTGATIYLDRTDGNANYRYRLVLFPLGGVPIAVNQW